MWIHGYVRFLDMKTVMQGALMAGGPGANDDVSPSFVLQNVQGVIVAVINSMSAWAKEQSAKIPLSN